MKSSNNKNKIYYVLKLKEKKNGSIKRKFKKSI